MHHLYPAMPGGMTPARFRAVTRNSASCSGMSMLGRAWNFMFVRGAFGTNMKFYTKQKKNDTSQWGS